MKTNELELLEKTENITYGTLEDYLTDQNGNIYRQYITINKSSFETLQKNIRFEIINNYENEKRYSTTNGYARIYLEPLELSEFVKENICFLNLTTTRFINLFIKAPIDNDMNTCLIVTD
jgi:hypothetical protein